MSILSLSIGELGFIISIALISLTLLTVCLVINFMQPKDKKHIIATIVVFILNGVNLAGLLELNRNKCYETFDKLSDISSFIADIPHYLQYLFLLSSLAFVLYEVHIIVLFLKKVFSNSVVREAIENLPTGLAFYDESGFLYLSNRIMHRLSLELTKKDLQNGLELQNDIALLQSEDSCVIRSEEPAFALVDNKIWQFSKSKIEIEGVSFTELRADDITEIYRISDEIRETNESLKLEKIRLAEHMKNIGRYVSEEETLRVKMAVHDDFGELIARTVRAYERRANREEKAEVIAAWSKLSQKMNRILTLDEEETNSLEKVLSLGKELGCEIEFIGTLPTSNINRELILSAVFEALKNAVYHAKADKITVTIVDKQDKIIASIYNEDKTKQEHITEGGGLTALREKIEKAKGSMKIICNNGVTLYIKLDNEVNTDV